MALTRICCLVLIVLWGAVSAAAQGLLDGFDRTERKIVQGALALTQDYDGLIDGAFGPRSNQALERFLARGQAGDRSARFDSLLQEMADEWRGFAWRSDTTPNQTIHFVRPDKSIPGGGLSVSINSGPAAAAQAQHQTTVASHTADGQPYTLRRDDLLVTASELSDGGRIYVRSDRHADGFDTLFLVADPANRGRLQLVASSVTKNGPPPLDPFAATRIVARIGQQPDTEITGLRIAPDLVFVPDGGRCSALAGPEDAPLDIVARDASFDLVLARGPLPEAGLLPLSQGAGTKIGAEVTVGGAPAKVLVTSSTQLIIGAADILAATDARPGQSVLRLTSAVPPGTPVRAGDGTLAGIVSQIVETETGPLALTLGVPTLAALIPAGTAPVTPSGASPEVTLTCRP